MAARLVIALCLCLTLAGLCITREGIAGPMPLRVRIFLTRIAPLLEQEDFRKAATELEAFRRRGTGNLDPVFHHAEINYVLGNCYLQQGNHTAARAAYQDALQSDPEHCNAWQNLAKAEYELENYLQAGEAFLTSYATAGKTRPELLYYAAATHLMAEKHTRSIELFEQLLADHPEAVELQWKEHLVHALLAVDQAERALPYIRELAESYTGEKQEQWLEILLQQYMALELHEQALSLARRLTRQYPTVATWWKAMAHIHLQADRYRDALTALTIYSFLTPPSREEKRLLADLHLQLGIPVKAVPDYEGCLAEKIDSATLQRLLQAYLDLGQAETALERLQILGKNLPDPLLAMQHADILFGLQRYRQAAGLYMDLASKETEISARAWLMAGYSFWQLKDFTASRQAFTEAAAGKRYKKEAERALAQQAKLSQLSEDEHNSE